MKQISSQSNIYSNALGSRPELVSSFRHVVLMVTVTTAGSAGSKIYVRGTAQEAFPNFATSATATNFHSTVQAKNLSDGSTINGTTGIPTTSTGVFLLEVNTNFLSWVAIDPVDIGSAVVTVDLVASTT